MVNIDQGRKRRMLVYAALLVVALLALTLSGCNAGNNTVNMANGVSEPTHFIAKFIMILHNGIGSFGWTVVVFTIILKAIMTPFDFWQKHITRKNAKIMERIRPRLEDLKAKCGDDKQRYNQEQMAIMKREKYSTFGACLPTILTLVVFIVVFAGFNQMVAYQNGKVYENAQNTYYQTYEVKYNELYQTAFDGLSAEEQASAVKLTEISATAHYTAIDLAQTAVKDNYKMESFLWVKNIFVQDAWNKAVPDYKTFSGQTGLVQAKVEGVSVSEYQTVMAKVLGTGGYGKNGGWNGLLLLPILSIVLNFVSQKLLMRAQGAPPPTASEAGAAMGNSKVMQYMMPVIMGVFALMYSSAFTTYILVSAIYTTLFQLLYNFVAMLVDKKNGVYVPAPKKEKKQKPAKPVRF